ncbi:NUDIX domain-containing protein [Nocardioides sp.]|uniref:NUDIX domain-containing protein n=1 Tax=Nocardioides sp. TaxID=35761 RepID=UPI00271F536C|nr:NUDIX hydrolase [Nocardioides sp.]MDO9457432.1 NUDIX hydrolase [Nocardioides sp.]
MSWTTCSVGHAHWGPYGAAGLLLARDATVLLQLRAGWAHHGGTWSLPGGALERGESPEQAALREAREELGLAAEVVAVRGSRVAVCGGWPYETVLGETLGEVATRDRAESAAHRWVPVDDVDALRLHPAFRLAWDDPDAVLRDFVAGTRT